jgi:hypothetical protein
LLLEVLGTYEVEKWIERAVGLTLTECLPHPLPPLLAVVRPTLLPNTGTTNDPLSNDLDRWAQECEEDWLFGDTAGARTLKHATMAAERSPGQEGDECAACAFCGCRRSSRERRYARGRSTGIQGEQNLAAG